MSTSTHPTQLLRLRWARLDELLVSGWLPLAAVVLGGLTLGFFAWYAVIVPRHDAALAQIGLLVAVPVFTAAALATWLGYARYFSRRSGTTLARSLRYDALSWLPFLLLWLTFTLQPQITHGARLFLVAATIFCVVKVLIAARFNQTVREVLLEFVATRAAIIVIAELAALIIGQRAGTHVQESSHVLLAVWGRWDAVHYIDIATKGYQGTDMAFFPLYPFLIRVVGALAGNHLVAGLLVSNASFFFGLLFLYKLLEHEYDRGVARRAIFYVSVSSLRGLLLGGLYRVTFLHAHRGVVLLHARASLVARGCDRLLRSLDARRGNPPGRAVRHRMVRSVSLRPAARTLEPAGGGPRPARAFRLYGVPLGLACRSALLFARSDSLEPASRVPVGQRRQLVP